MATFMHRGAVIVKNSFDDACHCIRHFGYLPDGFDVEVKTHPKIVEFLEGLASGCMYGSYMQWRRHFEQRVEKLRAELTCPNEAPSVDESTVDVLAVEDGYW